MWKNKKYRNCLYLVLLISGVMLLVSRCVRMNAMEVGGASLDNYYPVIQQPDYSWDNEEYTPVAENPFLSVAENPLSTFSIDVDVASYANCRRYINMGSFPPRDAVRLEEFVNYFEYDYPPPPNEEAVGASFEISACPWNTERLLARIGVKGMEIEPEDENNSRFTFLIDVSGSMAAENKLPLLQKTFKLLVKQLDSDDYVSIVVYAGSAGCILQPTACDKKTTINRAIDNLNASGSTAGGAGIQLAYSLAEECYDKNANNRVILASDGDFNVGISSEPELLELIEEKRDNEIYLTVLGFGMGNYKDSKMEVLADHGNGNYAYIDSYTEAEKVFIHDLGKMMVVAAKDVKLQAVFNPLQVKAYRLLGYENRLMKEEDFQDDKKDAGELGAGQTVTAFYEVIPADSDEPIPQAGTGGSSQNLEKRSADFIGAENDLFVLKVCRKLPDEIESAQFTFSPADENIKLDNPSADFTFAAAVIAYGLLLKKSEYSGNASFEMIREMAVVSKGNDPAGFKKEFIELVQRASTIAQ